MKRHMWLVIGSRGRVPVRSPFTAHTHSNGELTDAMSFDVDLAERCNVFDYEPCWSPDPEALVLRLKKHKTTADQAHLV